MRAVVIGGSGKIGNYLLPMLVKNGYETISAGRGRTSFVNKDPELDKVINLKIDRGSSDFETEIAELKADLVVDMICFSPESMLKLIDKIKGNVKHYIAVGSLWYHGTGVDVPMRENENRNPWGEYGINKLKMSDEIARQWKETGFPGTIVHPGHICVPWEAIINPQGNKNDSIFDDLRTGKEVLIPNFGLETLHHVHAGDVAGIINAVACKGEAAFGQDFHAASSRAVTLKGYAEIVASMLGQKANLKFMPYNEFRGKVPERDALMTLDHISRSPAASMEKAARILEYTSKPTCEIVRERLSAMGMIK